MPIISPKDAKHRPITPSSVCVWNDHGESCRYAGILSYSTNGSGPWYCREHWSKLNDYPVDGRGNAEPKLPLHSLAVDDILAKLKRGA